MVILISIYGFAFEAIGFPVATIALLLALMLWVDPVRPVLAVLLSVGVPFGVWYTVTKGLKIQMPAGVLAPWLG